MGAYLLGEDDARRLGRVVRQVEQEGRTPHEDAGASRLAAPSLLTLKVTSSTATTTFSDGTCNYAVYPAVVLQWSSSASCWTEARPVWVAHLANTAMVSGSRYYGVMVEHSRTISGDTRPLFVATSCCGGLCSTVGVPNTGYLTITGLSASCSISTAAWKVGTGLVVSAYENKSYPIQFLKEAAVNTSSHDGLACLFIGPQTESFDVNYYELITFCCTGNFAGNTQQYKASYVTTKSVTYPSGVFGAPPAGAHSTDIYYEILACFSSADGVTVTCTYHLESVFVVPSIPDAYPGISTSDDSFTVTMPGFTGGKDSAFTHNNGATTCSYHIELSP